MTAIIVAPTRYSTSAAAMLTPASHKAECSSRMARTAITAQNAAIITSPTNTITLQPSYFKGTVMDFGPLVLNHQYCGDVYRNLNNLPDYHKHSTHFGRFPSPFRKGGGMVLDMTQCQDVPPIENGPSK
jgi:hypothetical protein